MSVIKSGPEVDGLQLDPVGFHLEPLIPTEGIVLLYGKYSSFKTPITLNLAKAVASHPEDSLWGFPLVSGGNVLYIEGDTPERGIIKRIQQLSPLPANLDFAFIYPGFDVVNPHTPADNKSVCDELRAAHAAKKYSLVFVDSLRTSHTMPDKDSETPTKVYRAFAKMFPGAVIFVIHHDRKTKVLDRFAKGDKQGVAEMEAESFSGSQAWIDRATSAIKLRRHRQEDAGHRVTIYHHKNQVGVTAEPFDLMISDGITLTQATTVTEQEVIDAVPMFNGKWTRVDELEALLANWFQVSLPYAKELRKRFDGLLKGTKA